MWYYYIRCLPQKCTWKSATMQSAKFGLAAALQRERKAACSFSLLLLFAAFPARFLTWRVSVNSKESARTKLSFRLATSLFLGWRMPFQSHPARRACIMRKTSFTDLIIFFICHAISRRDDATYKQHAERGAEMQPKYNKSKQGVEARCFWWWNCQKCVCNH